MDFPFVQELLEYWLEYPPTHLLVRVLAKYEGKQKGNWGKDERRARRATEMDDKDYRPEHKQIPEATPEDARIASQFITGARHLDCAPPHIQQAIERAKKGKHFDIPQPV